MKARTYREALVPKHAHKVFEGEIFDMYQWEQELYDGSTAIFEKGSRPDTAIVFPITEEGKILIIEDSQPHRETALTTISGRVEDDETPEEAGKRELLEETGYDGKEWKLFYTSTPVEKLDWVHYAYIAKGCVRVKDPKPDAGEKIVVREVSFDELISLSAEGKLRGKDFQILVLHAMLDTSKMSELKLKFFN